MAKTFFGQNDSFVNLAIFFCLLLCMDFACVLDSAYTMKLSDTLHKRYPL